MSDNNEVDNEGDYIPEDHPVPNDIVPRLLEDAAKLYQTRRAQYGDCLTVHGRVMREMFPDGQMLWNADDFARFSILNLMVGKLVRYSNKFSVGGHRDSIRDVAVYAFNLEALDEYYFGKDESGK